MPFPLTEQQRAAVEDRGGGLLVSAAAGSGKTRVLVERLLRRVTEEEADLDRFLVITYTKAAAAELRGRIVEELGERLRSNPSDRHLRRQGNMVYTAQISTIHAFCAQLLREQGHRLDLDHDFRLTDEREAGVWMARAIDQVLESRYEAVDPQGDFAQLLDMMGAGRDDSGLAQIALDVYAKVQSHPRPHQWLEEQRDAFSLEGVEDVSQTLWGRLLLERSKETCDYWHRRLSQALEVAEGDEKMAPRYGPSLRETLHGLEELRRALNQGWDKAGAAACVPFPRFGTVRECGDPEGKLWVQAVRAKAKKRLEELAKRFGDSNEQLLEDMRLVAPAVRGLIDLVEDFDGAYTALKREKGVLDFADLEHLAVELLVDGEGRPTPIARQWSQRYVEVMVDEYQDTNGVQNAILQAVSDGGRKLFMVGDVKQSIYRFRLADPTIFLEKYRTFKPYHQAGPGENRRVLLSRNFRSRKGVLEGVNYLFRGLMSVPFGEMDYTDEEALYPGADFPGGEEDYALGLEAIDLSEAYTAEGERPRRDLMEARYVARRVKELLDGGFPVADGDRLRPCTAGDIVILHRSPNTVLPQFAQALGELDLPWEAEGGEDFLTSTEVSVALSYLRIVDNPRQDVALISVLRSPLYGFTPDRLSEIRALDRQGDFYTALEKDTHPDAVAFLARLEELRDLAGELSCHQLLWRIYDSTNFLGIFSALGDGATRRSNLLALAEQALEFEEAGYKGLFSFLTYLERAVESGTRFQTHTPSGQGRGVRIMSIHKAKGLEFPVVFLTGLMRRMNQVDTVQPVLFHPTLGIGPQGIDRKLGIRFPTIARRAVADQLVRELMAEELRLLYVAMTRAREKLILTLALTGGGKELSRLAPDAGFPVEPQALLGSAVVGQWVLLAALARPEAGILRNQCEGETPVTTLDCGPAWDIRWVDGKDLAAAPPRRYAQVRLEETREDGGEDLAAAYGWVYPHQAAVDIPSKLTATQLKGRNLDAAAAEEAPPPPRAITIRRPLFAQEELGLTAAEEGTALHLAMQCLDFSKTGSLAEIEGEIRRLEELEILSPQQAKSVDPSKIQGFFTSPLGCQVLACSHLHREFKFSILTPARDYYPEVEEGENVLLQGVVDCWMEEPDGLTIIDFKTDRVTEATVAEKTKYYENQLRTYGKALEKVTGKPVKRKILWYFALNKAVEL